MREVFLCHEILRAENFWSTLRYNSRIISTEENLYGESVTAVHRFIALLGRRDRENCRWESQRPQNSCWCRGLAAHVRRLRTHTKRTYYPRKCRKRFVPSRNTRWNNFGRVRSTQTSRNQPHDSVLGPRICYRLGHKGSINPRVILPFAAPQRWWVFRVWGWKSHSDMAGTWHSEEISFWLPECRSRRKEVTCPRSKWTRRMDIKK